MSYCRTIIFLLFIFINGVYAYIPYTYNLPLINENQNREFEPGWPSQSILDFGYGSENKIFAGTGAGPGMIDFSNYDFNVTIDPSEYLFRIVDDTFDTQGNNDYDSNPVLRTFPINNGSSLIAFSGVTSFIDQGESLPKGTGIFWSLDNGDTWNHIDQPIDNGNGDITSSWYGETFTHLSITTEVNNVSYDLSADVDQEYIYATSWAGMLRRFKYTDENPVWEVVPLPMDGQSNLSCNLECNSDNGNCSNEPYYYSPIDPPVGNLNHKPFSVLIEGGFIWVGTAGGINKGVIGPNGCIDWERYTIANGLGGNWVVGIHAEYINDFKRIWAITWGANNTSSHFLSYSDDNGTTWNKDNFLFSQGSSAVAYNIFTLNDVNEISNNQDRIYLSTSKGLFKHYLNRGCMDIAADNFEGQAYCPYASCLDECQYYLDVTDGCNLEENYIYLDYVGQNPTNNNEVYNVIFNTDVDIQSFEFSVSDILIENAFGGDAANNNFIIIPNLESVAGQSLGGQISAGSCGVLLTLEFEENEIAEFLYDIKINDNLVNEECFSYYTQDNQCIEVDSQWDEIFIPNISDADEKVYTTIMDDDGELWIGTTEGLNIAKQEQSILENEDSNISPINSIDCVINNTCPDGLLIYPNPYFLSSGKYANFILRTEFNGQLSIYDFSGNKVEDKECRHELNSSFINCNWDGLNKSNQRVSNGVYFCKIVTDDGLEYWEKLGVVNLK